MTSRQRGMRILAVGAAFVAGAAACNGPDEQTETTLPAVGVTTDDLPMSTSDSATTTPADGASETGGKLDVMPVGDAPNITEGMTGCDQDVDIVFVMDVSTTMGPFLDQLATEIIFVDEALDAMDLPGEPHYGLVVFVDDFALLNAGAPYDSVAVLQQDFNSWSAFTASNQQVGGGNFNSTWPENSLDAIYVAASGFQWRPAESTLRLVIHTTDDTFWDGPTTGNGVMIQHGYAETAMALQQREIRDFSFAGQIGGMCECEDVTMGWSSPYMGMDPIPQATGGGVYDIDLVLVGQVSLADAVVEAVETTMCEPYPPVG
ncbi:vWA domain-containing protein [Paraliomyxa miuraensis]|uniref:vWA domain-containing protein n=1 Tax=Paraliomyxa miuraensis TaxID=376150 RepID=UPI0022571A43|nr:vWA domain-containing protein [Paraliomyxa miuraensis]MCX4242849.1 VWA domain-containing protein [Paraliomyxa miuraensis]